MWFARGNFLHCVRDYILSKKIWTALGFHSNHFFSQMDLYLWIRDGVSSSHESFFLAGVWWAWRARNSQCLENESMHLHKLTTKVCFLLRILSVSVFITIRTGREWTDGSFGTQAGTVHVFLMWMGALLETKAGLGLVVLFEISMELGLLGLRVSGSARGSGLCPTLKETLFLLSQKTNVKDPFFTPSWCYICKFRG